jgi:glycerol-3-phosphate dehydrogenase subunit C
MQNGGTSEKTLRSVLDACADCDTCRFLMDQSCLLFPELYRLYDKEKKQGVRIRVEELQRLSELCTLCGLCPCPDIRLDVIRGKTERVRSRGMPLRLRMLADVQLFGRCGSRAPKLVNHLFSSGPGAWFIKKIMGIDPRRSLPEIAGESFFVWARRNGLNRPPERFPKVAYFAGCTAGYLFPEVARAAVGVLEKNGIGVHVPPQQCCGMPTLLEGDSRTTLERVGANLAILLKTTTSGGEVVCTCPTCGFLMKVLLKEGAYYSEAYQRSVGAAADEITFPAGRNRNIDFVRLKKSMYDKILIDKGYFAGLDPLERIALSDRIVDMGAYLDRLKSQDRLNIHFGRIDRRIVYFAPCHQREQGIGSPYQELLALIPGMTVVPVGGAMDCCGMGGSLGFKKGFHEESTRLARPLVKKIQAAEPEAVVTDCLSCRLQFKHLLPYPVYHPVEIIARAYESGRSTKGESEKTR